MMSASAADAHTTTGHIDNVVTHIRKRGHRMDDGIKTLIDESKRIALGPNDLDRDRIIGLLSIVPGTEEYDYLGKASRDVSRLLVMNQAKIGTSIGLDLCPCSASCEFCSLGEKWGLVKECAELSDEAVIRIVREKHAEGYFQFTLRTTEYYSLKRLGELGRRVRAEVPGDYYLTANTGELTIEDAKYLKECGFTAAYHVPRLGEGKYTPFSVEERLTTMRNVKAGGLMLSTGLDPIGPEFTNEELADKIIKLRNERPSGICVMRRESVHGTPLGDLPEISDERLSQIVAVVRLSFKGNIAVHPANQRSIDFGANNAAAEIGATPRQDNENLSEWIHRHDDIRAMFLNAGFDLVTKNAYGNNRN